MSDQYVAEIRMFPFNFAPVSWAQCNGQLIPISQNTALFSLLGTTYGGDGKTTFALPNLQGRGGLFFGSGNGLTSRVEGEQGGADTVTLLTKHIASHTHSLMGKASGGQADPSGKVYGSAGTQLPPPNFYSNSISSVTTMSPKALALAGSDQPHNNLMPNLVVNFCIALQGVFPSRN